jgi:hypothetical protein
MRHVRRALAELDAINCAGTRNGSGVVGEIRLAIRMPPIGEPIRSLLVRWRENHPGGAAGRALVDARESLRWASLATESILVRGRDESQTQRGLFASFMGSGTRFLSTATC